MDPDKLYESAHAEILADKARFAERVGISQIAWLGDIEPPGPSCTLQAVGQLYFGKRAELSASGGGPANWTSSMKLAALRRRGTERAVGVEL